jgi:hypothetical protein
MPEVDELYNSDPIFPSLNWTSEWLNSSSSTEVIFSANIDQNFEIGVRWAVDDSFQIIDEAVIAIIASSTGCINQAVKARFVQFFIQNIAASPSNFKSSGFFHTDRFL